MITRFLLKYFFRKDEEIGVLLGIIKQKGSPIAFVRTQDVWREETFAKKIKSVFVFKWEPSEYLLDKISKEVFYETTFGYKSDYNEALFKINYWHNSKEWDLNSLTSDDIKKSDSLTTLSVMLSNKHRRITSSYLHLHLFDRVPSICTLLHPIVIKIPVTSIQYCIEIHCAFAFNEIRLSNIDNSDDIISYIYEIQNLQFKTALSLNEIVYLIDYLEKHKGKALLIQAELSAINESENVINYLKATIEKTIVLLGLIFNLKNLETKKTHKEKLAALYKVIPEKTRKLFYFTLIEELVKSENLQELNNYRTGLLHKKGISKMQPHSFVGQNVKDLPLRDLFSFLMEQHLKNSTVIISTYALLADKLVELLHPLIQYDDLSL